MVCCPFVTRCLAALLMAAPLVIVAVSCGPAGTSGSGASKPAGTITETSKKSSEPGADPR